ncbi:MAG: hypothetical protein HY746_08170, partial [Elusimicrobia bacterium]|nr:hypothetical protein [Elusimicrobiota bacterium]
QIVIERNTAINEYWNGTGWDGTFTVSHWRNATNIYTSSWTYVDSNLNNYFNTLAGSLNFTVYTRARDTVGNVSKPDSAPSSGGVQFKMDRFAPVSKSTYPAYGSGSITYFNYPITNIAGTAIDSDAGSPSGLNQVYVRIRRFDSSGSSSRCDYDTTFGNWVNPPGAGWLEQSAGVLTNWIKSIPSSSFMGSNGGDCYNGIDKGDGFRFEIQSYARDNAQNTEVAYATATFIIDYSTPTAGIAFPVHLVTYFKRLQFRHNHGILQLDNFFLVPAREQSGDSRKFMGSGKVKRHIRFES